MRFNTDPAFAGLERLKTTHSDQIAKFEQWAARGEWELFHSSHYDWWVFPIHKPSAYGLEWTVYEGDVAALKKDVQFIPEIPARCRAGLGFLGLGSFAEGLHSPTGTGTKLASLAGAVVQGGIVSPIVRLW